MISRVFAGAWAFAVGGHTAAVVPGLQRAGAMRQVDGDAVEGNRTMTEQKQPGTTVRNWDLPGDGARLPARSDLDRVADQVWDDAREWPAEIEMVNGPNIVVHDREEHDYVRAAMAQNARLAARNEP